MKFEDLTPDQVRKAKRGFCVEKFCRKKGQSDYLCHCHSKRVWADKYPLKYVFANLRGNAKRRKKDFSLTLEEFEGFVNKNNYMELRGKTKFSLSIDRDKNEFGYHVWNIKAITLQANSFKRNYIDYGSSDTGIEEPF